MRPDDASWAIVDTHQHFQSLSDAAYPWLDPDRPEPLEGDLSPIRRDYLPSDYRRDMDGLGIVKTGHVQNGRIANLCSFRSTKPNVPTSGPFNWNKFR